MVSTEITEMKMIVRSWKVRNSWRIQGNLKLQHFKQDIHLPLNVHTIGHLYLGSV